jgi:antirestriction protein
MGRMSIYLTNLGEYVDGCLIGQWVQLPIPQERLQEVLTQIGIGDEYEEYFITDSETDILDISIDEYASIDELNELAAKIEELADFDYTKLAAVLEWESPLAVAGVIEIIENLDSYDLLPDVEDDEALGEYFGVECGAFDTIPEQLRYYIDYEHYGRDIRLELDMCFTSYGAVIRN